MEEKKSFSCKSFIGVMLIFGLIFVGIITKLNLWNEEFKFHINTLQMILFFLAISIAGGTIFYVIPHFLKAYALKVSKHEQKVESLSNDINNIQKDFNKDFFNKLVKINFKYLDSYYLQTQGHADKAFRLSLTAFIVGFIIIVTGVTFLLLGKTWPGYITVSAGTIIVVMSVFLFKQYNNTVLKMGEYHQKLILAQNMSLSLKIANGLPTDRQAESKMKLIEQLSLDINKHLVSHSGQ